MSHKKSRDKKPPTDAPQPRPPGAKDPVYSAGSSILEGFLVVMEFWKRRLPPIVLLPEMDPYPCFRRRMPTWALSGALYEIPVCPAGRFSIREIFLAPCENFQKAHTTSECEGIWDFLSPLTLRECRKNRRKREFLETSAA